MKTSNVFFSVGGEGHIRTRDLAVWAAFAPPPLHIPLGHLEAGRKGGELAVCCGTREAY